MLDAVALREVCYYFYVTVFEATSGSFAEGFGSLNSNIVMMEKMFRVLLTADFYDEKGQAKFADLGLSEFEAQPQIEHGTFVEHRQQIGPDQIADAQGVVVLTPAVTAESLSRSDNLIAIGRFGVGYDTVDVQACTDNDVVLYITSGAVDRSVAEATVGWMIALTHHVRAKDNLLRAGQWNRRTGYMGGELRDRTLGLVGMGGIGRAVVRLLRGFEMNQPLVFDPYIDSAAAKEMGVRLVELGELMKAADIVSVHCPLNDSTRDLIGAEQIELMKPTSYLLNTARGGIVNEDALYRALQTNRIAGAALDCFVGEPITMPHRFGELENVLLAPHCIAWTDEMFRDIGHAACRGMVDLSLGRQPNGVINREVFEHDSFQKKWKRMI